AMATLAVLSTYYGISQLNALKKRSAGGTTGGGGGGGGGNNSQLRSHHQRKIDLMTRWFLASSMAQLAALCFVPLALLGSIFYSPAGFTAFLFGILSCMLM